MPEIGERGYQPSPEELKLGQDRLEAMGITEEQTERGSQHVDSAGVVIDRTETWAHTQAIQYEYLPDGGAIEHGKIIDGEQAGKELQREHPMTSHTLQLRWEDPDLGPMVADVQAVLEALGQTTTGGQSAERWAHFETTDPSSLQGFADLTRDPGTMYATSPVTLGRPFEAEINGRTVRFEAIGKVSVDFGPDGLPTKATFHKISWSELSAAA